MGVFQEKQVTGGRDKRDSFSFSPTLPWIFLLGKSLLCNQEWEHLWFGKNQQELCENVKETG